MIWVYGFLLACTTETPITEEQKITPEPVQTQKEMVIESTELRVFEMQDGTKITGVLLGTDGEAFKVRSKSLGEIRIPMNELKRMNPLKEEIAEERIQPKPTLSDYAPTRNIVSHPTLSSSSQNQEIPSPNPMNPKIIKTIQDTMMEDPEIMGILHTLQNDPQLMRALQDPEIIQLIQKGDLEAINKHPTFKMLESNEQIRDILNRMR